MRTRTRNALALGAFAAGTAAALAVVAKNHGGATTLRAGRAVDAVPAGAILLATADLDALRASPMAAPFLRPGREIAGVGKIKDVCGFDPVDEIHDVAIAIPAGGEPGDFGLAAAGDFQDDALVDCATRIIQKRGGRPVVAPLGAFRTVKDAASPAGGEIAVKKGGPLLLGAGPYLRAMIDAAEGRTAAIRTSQAHAMLARAVGEGALRLTFVLTQEQRSALKSDLDRGGSIVAGGLAIGLGPEIRAHGVLECPTADACADVARSLVAAKEARAGDLATRIVGFGDVLDRTTIEPEGAFVHVRVEVSAEEAGKLVDTAVKLGAFRHPMPTQAASAEPRASASASPPPPSAGASASPPRAAASAAPSASARSKPR